MSWPWYAWLSGWDWGTAVIYGGVAAIVGIAVWMGSQLVQNARQLSKALDRARDAVLEVPDARAMTACFDRLEQQIGQDPLIGPAWQQFTATVFIPGDDTRPLGQTIPAERFFNAGLLRATKINPGLYAALPNLLVGGGLFLTFIGLILALNAASDSVAAADAATARGGLQTLLHAASLKFISSLVGLGTSIAYLIVYRNKLHCIDRQAHSLCAALAQRIPPVTVHGLADHSNTLLNQQLEAQQQLVTDLALRLGETLDQSFNRRLSEQIEPLRMAIERMAEGMSRMNQDALSEMVGRFANVLQEKAEGQLQSLAGTLGRMGDRLESLTASFSETQARISRDGEASATRMMESSQAAAGAMNQAAAALEEHARDAASNFAREVGEAIRGFGSEAEILRDALSALSGQIREASSALGSQTTAVNQANAELAEVATSLHGVANLAAQAAMPLRETCEALVATDARLRETAETLSATQNQVAGLAEGLNAAAARFDGIDRELARTADELVVAIVRSQQQVTEFATAVDQHMSNAVRSLAAQIEQLNEIADRGLALNGQAGETSGRGVAAQDGILAG